MTIARDARLGCRPDQVRDSAAGRDHDVRVRDARRAQDPGLDAAAAGAEPRRTVGIDAAGSRCGQADPQGRPHAQDGRSADLPFGAVHLAADRVCGLRGHSVRRSSAGTWAIGNVNAGILFLLAITSLGVYGISLGGWASGSKYPLLGSVRSTAQMISYELSMSLSFDRRADPGRNDSLDGIVDAQATLVVRRPADRRLHHLHHYRGRRNQSRAVRLGRSRDRTGRRLPHRVLGLAVRPVLHRRVRQHAHRLVHRDAAVLRRLERAVRP